MPANRHLSRFWLGNAILAVALVVLLGLGPLWELMGVWAMVLWIALAAAGVILVMSDRQSPGGPAD